MKRVITAILCLAMLVSLAACGTPTSSTPQTTTAPSATTAPSVPVKEETFLLTQMKPMYEAQPPADNSPVQIALQEAMNIKVETRWVPTGTYTEVFNTTLATKDIPMKIDIPSSLAVNPGFMKYCVAGVFWDLTDKIASRPVLFEEGRASEVTLATTMIDGRNYMLTQTIAAARVAVIYRQDWAEKVNAPVPNTLANFYEMARLFTENDPNGSGKKDTYGFAYIDDADKELAYAGFTTLSVANGAPNLWGNVNGKITPDFETQEYMDTLNFFKDMYDKGYMNDDFYIIKGNDKYSPMLSGQAGMMMTSATNAAFPGGKFDPIITADPNVKVAYVTPFETKDGKKIINSVVSVGAVGGPVFPKNSCTEEQLDKIFDLIVAVSTNPEWDKLNSFGIEGVHYSLDAAGKITRSEAQILLRTEDGSKDFSFVPGRVLDKDYGQDVTPAQKITREILPNDQYALVDASAGVMDGDMLAKSTSIATIISDARVKYILGNIDEAGFKAAVQEWKDAGGQDIIDGLNK